MDKEQEVASRLYTHSVPNVMGGGGGGGAVFYKPHTHCLYTHSVPNVMGGGGGQCFTNPTPIVSITFSAECYGGGGSVLQTPHPLSLSHSVLNVMGGGRTV